MIDGCTSRDTPGNVAWLKQQKSQGGGGYGLVDDLGGGSADVGGQGWVAGNNSSGHVLDGQVLEK